MRERERERKRETETDNNIVLSLPLIMDSLADSRMCPDRGSNPQPWCMGMMF